MANIATSADHLRTIREDPLAYAVAVLAHSGRRRPNLKLTDVGLVYFIQASVGGPIKIGTTTNLRLRVKKLQQAHAYKLGVLALRKGGVVTERKYHAKFKQHRLHGEWFEPHPDILAEIDRLTPSEGARA